MAYLLEQSDIEAIAQAAARAGLLDRSLRKLLFAGIETSLWKQWADDLPPIHQIRSDLQELVALFTVDGGPRPPLFWWLDNAERLASDRPESQLFVEMSQRARLRFDSGLVAPSSAWKSTRSGHGGHGRRYGLHSEVAGRVTLLCELTVALTPHLQGFRVSWFAEGRQLPVPPTSIERPRFEGIGSHGLMALLFPGGAPGRTCVGGVLSALGLDTDPRRCSIRLRICTSDASAAALPWHTLSYEGQHLVGANIPWTVEIVDAVDPSIAVNQPQWPTALVVGPESKALELASATSMSLPDYAGSGSIRSVSSLEALGVEIESSARSVVMARVDSDDAVTRLYWALTHRADSARAPVALCLVGRPGGSLPMHLLARAPLVVCFTDFDAAKQWFVRVVADGKDPVVAAYEVTTTPARALAGRAYAVISAYRSWRALPVVADQTPPPANVLDRRQQRNWVTERISTMLESPHRHVEVFVASGEMLHRIDLLSRQLETHIGDRLDAIKLKSFRPELPRSRATRPAGARQGDEHAAALAGAMGKAEISSPQHVANALLRSRDATFPCVFWLDWGAYGTPSDDRPNRWNKLNRRELRRWLTWHVALAEAARHLALNDTSRRPGLRIAAFIGCRTDRADVIREVLDEVTLATDLSAVEFNLLPPLGPVTVSEVRQYLNSPKHSRVLPEHVGPLTRAIVQAAAGKGFDDYVGHLESGRLWGWPALLERLEGRRYPRDDDKEEV